MSHTKSSHQKGPPRRAFLVRRGRCIRTRQERGVQALRMS
jgi:hypothetical protein